MVLTAGCWGRQYRESFWTSSSFSSILLILAYMTDSNWMHHTPEVGAKSTVRLKKRPPAHQTKLHSLKAVGTRGNEKEGSKRGKKWVRIERKTSHCSPSVILADKRTNYISASRHPRVRIGRGSLSALFECEHVDIGSISSHKRGAPAYLSAFHLGFFYIPLYTCVCCLCTLLGRIDCYYSKQHYLY